jgi:hypothetical protein
VSLGPEAKRRCSPGEGHNQRKAAEIAAEFLTTFYHLQVGALETQEFRTKPVPFWLQCFSDTIRESTPATVFRRATAGGRVVVPRVAKRL